MSQRDSFGSGFLAGAIFGSVVGGIVGAVITPRRDMEFLEEEPEQLTNGSMEGRKPSPRRRQMKATEDDDMSMETARRSLEDKIAQLNATIDEVRNQLGNVNGSDRGSHDRASLP
jgi:predicted RNase H-like nuclease (RuvC/YqgF family)